MAATFADVQARVSRLYGGKTTAVILSEAGLPGDAVGGVVCDVTVACVDQARVSGEPIGIAAIQIGIVTGMLIGIEWERERRQPASDTGHPQGEAHE